MKLKYFILIPLFLAMAVQGKADKLSKFRTSKKIITMERAVAPFYAIQIIALKEPPGVPSFFQSVEMAEEYVCADGFVRYTVGKFNSFEEAGTHLAAIRAQGYKQAFVVNTSRYVLDGNNIGTTSGSQGKSQEIDPNRIYTIQVSAFRFPVYLSYFENLDNVMEFRMKDRIFRYCVGRFPGRDAGQELAKIKALGYSDAFLVELDNYLPYKIE